MKKRIIEGNEGNISIWAESSDLVLRIQSESGAVSFEFYEVKEIISTLLSHVRQWETNDRTVKWIENQAASFRHENER